jgi:hypothetical protein
MHTYGWLQLNHGKHGKNQWHLIPFYRKKILYDPISYDPTVDPILHRTRHKLYGDLIIRYGDLLNQRLLLFEIHGGRCGPRLGRTRLGRIGFFSFVFFRHLRQPLLFIVHVIIDGSI